MIELRRRRMCKVAVGTVALAWATAVPGLRAQQPVSPSPQQPPQSIERLRAALETPRGTLVSPPRLPPVMTGPVTKTWGVVSLMTPDGTTTGEVVKVMIPAGELTMRAARVVAAVQRRRAERRAHAEVIRDLQEFQARRAR